MKTKKFVQAKLRQPPPLKHRIMQLYKETVTFSDPSQAKADKTCSVLDFNLTPTDTLHLIEKCRSLQEVGTPPDPLAWVNFGLAYATLQWLEHEPETSLGINRRSVNAKGGKARGVIYSRMIKQPISVSHAGKDEQMLPVAEIAHLKGTRVSKKAALERVAAKIDNQYRKGAGLHPRTLSRHGLGKQLVQC
jgi:hypothetical protein